VAKEDKIAGAAVIHRPGAYPLPASDQISILWKVFAKVLMTKWAPAVFGRWLKWSTAIEKIHPKEPHYYLEFIGVDTPIQGRGLGSQMLQRLVGQADEERTGCYLETGNPRNLPLYRCFGFQTTAGASVSAITYKCVYRGLRSGNGHTHEAAVTGEDVIDFFHYAISSPE
jgi:GNAT superfamily N-acetyltransferase